MKKSGFAYLMLFLLWLFDRMLCTGNRRMESENQWTWGGIGSIIHYEWWYAETGNNGSMTWLSLLILIHCNPSARRYYGFEDVNAPKIKIALYVVEVKGKSNGRHVLCRRKPGHRNGKYGLRGKVIAIIKMRADMGRNMTPPALYRHRTKGKNGSRNFCT